MDAQFTVVVNVTNPNDREIAIDAIDADVRIEDVPSARRTSPRRCACPRAARRRRR